MQITQQIILTIFELIVVAAFAASVAAWAAVGTGVI